MARESYVSHNKLLLFKKNSTGTKRMCSNNKILISEIYTHNIEFSTVYFSFVCPCLLEIILNKLNLG